MRKIVLLVSVAFFIFSVNVYADNSINNSTKKDDKSLIQKAEDKIKEKIKEQNPKTRGTAIGVRG
jgi:hypothetical protein